MTNLVNELTVQLPIVLTDDEAAQIADKMLYRAWTERDQFEIRLPIKYAYLDPGDVIEVTADGDSHTIRIQTIDMSLPGLLVVKGVADKASTYDSNAVGGGSNFPPQLLPSIGDTELVILDIPALSDQDAVFPGIYFACCGVKDNWDAAIIYESKNFGDTWNPLTSTITESTMGITTNALGDYLGNDWDVTNTVNVSLQNGTLSSDTEINVLNGENRAAIGKENTWEIIHFQNAVLEVDGTYTLSHLIRGRSGTHNMKGEHAPADKFVLLDSPKVKMLNLNLSNLFDTFYYKAVTNRQYFQDVTDYWETTLDTMRTSAWPVVQLHGVRDGSNNLTIYWERCSRYTSQMLHDPVLGENSEAYYIKVYNDSSELKYEETIYSTREFLLTNTVQTSSGMTLGSAVTFRVYQLTPTWYKYAEVTIQ